MIQIQQDFCKILIAEKNELKEDKKVLKEVSSSSIVRWLVEQSSPSLKDVDKILEANNLPQPFFYDGKIESLINFSKRESEKLGIKVTFIFE